MPLAAFWFLLAILSSATCQTNAAESTKDAETATYRPLASELIDKLWKKCSLADQSIPTIGNDTLNIELQLDLYRFQYLSDKDERFVVSADITMVWYHPCLSWDTGKDSKWQNIDRLVANPNQIWRPVVQHINAAEDMFSVNKLGLDITVHMYPDGKTSWSPTGRFDSICELDLRKFPFDSQNCEILIESWESVEKINFSSATIVMFEKEKIIAKQDIWRLLRVEAELVNITYNSDENAYSRAVFRLHMKRNYFYYFGSTILPSAALTFLLLTTFLMPPKHTDRPYFASAVVLSIAVMLVYVSGIMPVTSQVVLFSVNLSCSFAIGTVVTAYAALSCALARHKYFNRPRFVFPWPFAKGTTASLNLIRLLDICVGSLMAIVTLLINVVIYALITTE